MATWKEEGEWTTSGNVDIDDDDGDDSNGDGYYYYFSTPEKRLIKLL